MKPNPAELPVEEVLSERQTRFFELPGLEETRLTVHGQVGHLEMDEADIEVARTEFERVRRAVLREVFLEQLRRPGLRTVRMYGLEEDERQPLVFDEADVDGFIDGGDHLLPADFFDKQIVPLVRSKQEATLAIECLPSLYRLSSSRTHETTHPDTLTHFFAPSGPFLTFIKTHGTDAVRACAEFEGGGCFRTDKEDKAPWFSQEILELLTPSLELLPAALHSLFFKAFGAQSSRSRRYGIEFARQAPEILRGLEAHGHSNWIPYWLALAETGSLSYREELLELDTVLKDMKLIMQWHEEQPGAFHFFLFCLKEVFRDSGHGGVRFGTGWSNSLPDYIKDLKDEGLTPEEIETLLDEYQGKTYLPPRNRLALLRGRKKIDEAFPGGLVALEDYLVRISSCPRGVSRLIWACEEQKIPKENLQAYLSQGLKLATLLGDAAANYFSHFFSSRCELIKEDPEEFVRRMERIVQVAQKLRHLRTLIKSHPRSTLFQACLQRMDDSPEQFDAFLAGAEKMIATCTSTDTESGDFYEEILADYLYPKSVFFNLNHRPKDDGFEAKVDWCMHADRVLQYFLNPSDRGPYQWAYFVTQRAPWLSGQKLFERLDGLPPYAEEEVQELVALVDEITAVQNEIYKTRRETVVRDSLKELHRGWNARCDELTEKGVRVKHSELFEPESLNEIRTLIDDVCSELAFRRFAYGIIQPDVHVQASDFLRQAHPGTQLAVMGGALAHALGAMRNPRINGEFGPIPMPQAARMLAEGSSTESPEGLIESDFGRELRRRLQVIVLRIEGQILAERYATAGLCFVGGKTHADEAISPDRLAQVNALFGLDENTPFSLMHHNAVRLPPAPTGLEQVYSTALFQLLGVRMDSKQVCGAGHWPEEVCRVVAATYLLGTDQCPVYSPGAFGTTDDERTGYRLLVRGKGVVDRTVPFFVRGIPSDEDRTDKLGSASENDFVLGQLISTLVQHALYGGRYASVGRAWLHASERLFEERGVSPIVRSTIWIKQHAPGTGIDDPEHHEGVVNRLTELWRSEVVRPNAGLVGEVQQLLARASDEISGQAEAVRVEEPAEFMRMITW